MERKPLQAVRKESHLADATAVEGVLELRVHPSVGQEYGLVLILAPVWPEDPIIAVWLLPAWYDNGSVTYLQKGCSVTAKDRGDQGARKIAWLATLCLSSPCYLSLEVLHPMVC